MAKRKKQEAMTVAELIELLKTVEQDRIVVMSKDSEGNGYSPFSGIFTAAYRADSTWSGEIGLEELTDEDRKQGYSDEDVIDGVPCIVLQPTN
mgnify:FL=1